MPGIPESKESLDSEEVTLVGSLSVGFKDPDNQYPTSHRLEEPDVHRLARGVSDGTLVETQNDNRDLGVPEALGGSWDEPVSPYNAEYPNNLVIATHGGLTLEMDSTPGSARLNLYHPSNSYIQIDNDGVMVIRNNDKKYEVVLSDNNIHIKRDRNITIDNDSKKFVKGNEVTEISGNKAVEIDGDMGREIGGDKDETITGDLTITVAGNVQISSTGPATITSPVSTITGGSVKLGNSLGSLKKMVNEDFLTLVYDPHVHSGVAVGGNNTGPPSPLSSGEITSDTEAS
jgi:hypothetical protein